MNAETRAIGGGIPHQDAAVDTNYGVVIYLNKPEECSGGTRLYSYCGQQSQTCANSHRLFIRQCHDIFCHNHILTAGFTTP